ncbi:MAG: hypothetical protein PVI78_01675 [Anaerolineales bacterium]|jgi:hypothetical protein
MKIVEAEGLEKLEIGGGRVAIGSGAPIRMTIPSLPHGYADAQLDDYRTHSRANLPWSPPVRFSLRARASHPQPLGTLGFGFWNDPFTLSLGQGGAARRLPSAPQTVWFFYGSLPNHFTFTPGIEGHGFKAMALRSPTIPSLVLAPLAAAGLLLAQLPVLRRPVLRTALQKVQSCEAVVDVSLDSWHRYAIHWLQDWVCFEIDGQPVLQAEITIPSPLGFVTWIDNQYAIASPEKGFRFGVIPTDHSQWLEVSDLVIVSKEQSAA